MSSFDWLLPASIPPNTTTGRTSTGSLLGKGLSFPLRMDSVTNDFQGAIDEDNVEKCLRQLIFTCIGERMDALIGTIIPETLFEDTGTLPDLAQPSIMQAILRNEPRVKVVNLDVRAQEFGQGASGIVIALRYIIKATNRRRNMVVPYVVPEAA